MYSRNKWCLEIDTWVEKPCSQLSTSPTEVPGERSSDSEKSSVRGETSSPPKCPLSEGSLAIILELSNSLLLQLSLQSDGSPAIILFWSCLILFSCNYPLSLTTVSSWRCAILKSRDSPPILLHLSYSLLMQLSSRSEDSLPLPIIL